MTISGDINRGQQSQLVVVAAFLMYYAKKHVKMNSMPLFYGKNITSLPADGEIE